MKKSRETLRREKKKETLAFPDKFRYNKMKFVFWQEVMLCI